MRPAGRLVLRSVCLCVVGLDRAAFKKNRHSFTKTACLKSSVCFPLWSGLSEPSQTHSPLGSLNGNLFELPRGSDTLPQPGCHGAPGGTSGSRGRWPAPRPHWCAGLRWAAPREERRAGCWPRAAPARCPGLWERLQLAIRSACSGVKAPPDTASIP